MSDTVEIKAWAKVGNMLVNTEFLDHDHPLHPYNQIKDQGLCPEDFGLEHPVYGEFEDKSRSDLINEIVSLRKTLESYVRNFG